MPTILLILGWRLYFWANENNEPIHVHGKHGGLESKAEFYIVDGLRKLFHTT